MHPRLSTITLIFLDHTYTIELSLHIARSFEGGKCTPWGPSDAIVDIKSVKLP